MPEASLEFENDQDYLTVQEATAHLRARSARLWRQLGFAFIESGNLAGLPVFLLIVWIGTIYWLWQNPPHFVLHRSRTGRNFISEMPNLRSLYT